MRNHKPYRIAARERMLAIVVVAHSLWGCAIPLEKSALLKDNTPNISHIQGPQERSLRNFFRKQREEDDPTFGQPFKPIEGESDYLAAFDLYKDEKYQDAFKAFKKVAKKYKKSEIKEDALFMEAECAWKQDHYAKAHDCYALLLKDYPSTRHLSVVSERMFKIGRLWLDFPEVAKLSEIQQVNFDEPTKPLPSEEAPKVPKKVPFLKPNFANPKEPLFDTAGNGVAALRAVWMNDPTGPLADDSMMLVASYFARRGNYVEAKQHFQNLREMYPSSPHVQTAYILNAHVAAMCYEGPSYETRPLDEAKLLKECILRLYQDYPDRGRIRDELAKLEDTKAEVVWKRALFYQKKGKKRACSIFCHEVITQYPKSPYAELAKTKLLELGPQFESGGVFLTMHETQQRTLAERILEPKAPDWMKDPRVLVASRRKPSKKSDTSDDNPDSGETIQAAGRASTSDGSSSDDDSKPPRISSKGSDKPRLLPSQSEGSSDSGDEEDDEKPSNKSSTGRVRL